LAISAQLSGECEMGNEILFQLEKASFGDVIEREVMTAGVVRVESAIVGTQIGREEEGVRVIVAKQMGGGTMHLAGDEQEGDREGGGRNRREHR